MSKIKDPFSAISHLVGLLLSIPCTAMLIQIASRQATAWHVVSLSIFGASLILLYSASTIYHMLELPEKASEILRKIDHMMIFILIAGSYTPICLVPLRGLWGWTLLVLVWAMAVIGIILKAFWKNQPRSLSTVLYVVMGWVSVVVIYPLFQAIPSGGVALLVLGGVAYTAGAIIYGFKWPRINFKWFGFHDLFHIFVLLGSAFHVLLMFKYIV